MTAPLTRADLDHLGCDGPACTHDHSQGLAIHGGCHPSAPVECWYRAGVLAFHCKRCAKLVVEIAVAGGDQRGGA